MTMRSPNTAQARQEPRPAGGFSTQPQPTYTADIHGHNFVYGSYTAHGNLLRLAMALSLPPQLRIAGRAAVRTRTLLSHHISTFT